MRQTFAAKVSDKQISELVEFFFKLFNTTKSYSCVDFCSASGGKNVISEDLIKARSDKGWAVFRKNDGVLFFKSFQKGDNLEARKDSGSSGFSRLILTHDYLIQDRGDGSDKLDLAIFDDSLASVIHLEMKELGISATPWEKCILSSFGDGSYAAVLFDTDFDFGRSLNVLKEKVRRVRKDMTETMFLK